MTKKILLYFALLLWLVVPSSAQLTFLAPNMVVTNGESIKVDIKTVGFDSILSMQFSINWNQNTLEFDSILTSGALPNYSIANFGTNQAFEGKLTTGWFDLDFLPASLEDSTVIFSIIFDVIGAPDSSSHISFTGDPTMIEIGDIDGNILPVTLENGMIIVDNPLGIDPFNSTQTNEQFSLYPNEPNPFSTHTNIRFDLNRSDDVNIQIFDIKGQLIHSFKNYFLEGSHTVTIDANKLPRSGTYYYRLQTNDNSITNKMIFVR